MTISSSVQSTSRGNGILLKAGWLILRLGEAAQRQKEDKARC